MGHTYYFQPSFCFSEHQVSRILSRSRCRRHPWTGMSSLNNVSLVALEGTSGCHSDFSVFIKQFWCVWFRNVALEQIQMRGFVIWRFYWFPRSEISNIKEPFRHFLYFLSSKQTKTVTWEIIPIILILTFGLCSEFLMCWGNNGRQRRRLQLQEQQDSIDGWLHSPHSIASNQHCDFFFLEAQRDADTPGTFSVL